MHLATAGATLPDLSLLVVAKVRVVARLVANLVLVQIFW